MTDYTTLRQTLHEHPQTAGNEQYAHDTIVHHLQGLHPDHVYTHVGGWGVVAVWDAAVQTANSSPVAEGPHQVPTVAFRADTDALPIGHRCGHDGHTTALLRLAELVDDPANRSPLHHTMLIWQPAEETGEGARAVLESGILQKYKVSAIYGMHNIPGVPLGTVVICPHTFAAASTGVIYRLEGRETHASTPEMGINPGLAVAEIIKQFNRFNNHVATSEETEDPDDAPAELLDFRQSTLICVHLGSPAFGTSAGQAEVMFTLRAFSNDSMEKLLADANNTVDEVAAHHGLRVTRTLQEPFHATENTEHCVDMIEQAAQRLGLAIHNKTLPFRWSEDFAEYLLQYPGAMFGMGSGTDHAELHHPDYDFPDTLVDPIARMFLELNR